MIYNKQYDSALKPILGELELTAQIDDIQNPLENIADGYYLGYVLYNDYPKCFNINTIDYTVDQPLMTISHVKENHSWGFIAYDYNSSQPFVEPLLYYYDENNNIQRRDTGNHSAFNGDNARFINRAIISKLTWPEDIQIKIHYMIIRNDCYDFDGNGSNFDNTPHNVTNLYDDKDVLLHLSYAQLKDMVDNDTPIYTVNITVNGTTITSTLKYSEFNEYNMIVKEYNSSYSIVAIISGYYIRSYAKYYGLSDDNGIIPVVPFFSTSIPQNRYNIPVQENAILCSPANDETYLTVTTRQGAWGECPLASVAVTNGFNICQGCFPYDYFDTRDSVEQIIHNPDGGADYGMGINRSGIYKKMIYVKATGGSQYSITFNFYPQNDLSDILKAACFLNKTEISVDDVTNVTANNTYTTAHSTAIFKTTNEPEWIRKNEIYNTIEPILRLWQKIDIQIITNEYDPADLPPYEPTPGGDGENVGDNITRPSTLGIGGTNGFVTQYALRASDIQELGQILWTSVFDSDYWQNYMFSLALDTGSFSMSSLLSFFVSLKVYPFALLNVPSYSQIGKNMYVGTGIHALEFTNNLHTINNYCDYIPGGSCTVWSGYFFNDYRDYINATYTLYVPYCGTIELNPGDVVHSELTVQYAVDFATGGCVAYVDVTTQDGAQFTIAALPGQIGADVPLTATAAGAVASRFIGDAMKFGGLISGEVAGVAGGVASAMMGNSPSGGSGNVLSGMAAMVGGPMAAVGMDLAPGFAMQAANMIARGAVAAPMMSGGQGFASFGAPQTPYVQIRRGIYPDVTGLSTVCGSRGAGTYTIGELSGFVQGDIKTDGLNCPENEKVQIRQLIAKGIYV